MSWLDLRRATPARIALGRSGTALPTAAQLDFQLAHARARDAVHATLDVGRIVADLRGLGLEALPLRSQAAERATYLRRPDLGQKLSEASRQTLTKPGHDDKKQGCDVVFVVADGLSATAVNAHAVALITGMLPRLTGLKLGPVAVVEGGRVAIGDEIGGRIGADLAAVLIGERPGLSAADSLGVYVTWQPAPGAVDAARNCLSNIRAEGMPVPEAAEALLRLMENARRHRMTGIALSRRLAELPAS